MMRYCLGIVRDEETRRFLLVEKARPGWQSGCLNGVGGKVIDGESFGEAMAREGREEIGDCSPTDWLYFAVVEGRDFVFYCYAARGRLAHLEGQVSGDGEVFRLLHDDEVATERVVYNLRYLVPMARLRLMGISIDARIREGA